MTYTTMSTRDYVSLINFELDFWLAQSTDPLFIKNSSNLKIKLYGNVNLHSIQSI